jgi:uracil phosphoribosyltransferase
MTTAQFPRLRLVRHPVADACLAELRQKNAGRASFRHALERLSFFLAIEATRDLGVREISIETPLEPAVGVSVCERVVKVPILRAGLALLPGFEWVLPGAPVGHVGVARNETTLLPDAYLERIPGLEGATTVVLDPMIATGGSAAHTISVCKQRGAGRCILAGIIAAPEGIRHLAKTHPDVDIVAIALDRELNDRGFILPGLGDAGDRYFGTFE